MKIMIDPGHGGKALGAIGPSGIKEKNINLGMAFVLQGILYVRGYEVFLTRDKDVDVSLSARVTAANRQKVNLFVSLHCNASKLRNISGMEVYSSVGKTHSDIWAKTIQDAMLLRFYGHKDFAGKGTSEENFYVLRKTKASAVLIEAEFISNPIQEFFLKTQFQEISCCIADAIDQQFTSYRQ